MEIRVITPEVAKEMLSNNIKNNRTPNKNNVDRYSEMMKKGLWIDLHPQPIIISNDGELLDGQHRLRAVILSGKTIKCYIATKDKSIMATIDDGKKRTPGDACKIADIPNSNIYSAIMRSYKNMKHSTYFTSAINKNIYSNLELIDLYYNDSDKYDNIVNISRSFYNHGRLLSISVYGSLFMLFNESNSEYAFDFFNQLSTGKNINNNTIYILRQKLISEKSSTKKTPPAILVALIIKTWNAVIEGKQLGTLKFNPVTENYPKIKTF